MSRTGGSDEATTTPPHSATQVRCNQKSQIPGRRDEQKRKSNLASTYGLLLPWWPLRAYSRYRHRVWYMFGASFRCSNSISQSKVLSQVKKWQSRPFFAINFFISYSYHVACLKEHVKTKVESFQVSTRVLHVPSGLKYFEDSCSLS